MVRYAVSVLVLVFVFACVSNACACARALSLYIRFCAIYLDHGVCVMYVQFCNMQLCVCVCVCVCVCRPISGTHFDSFGSSVITLVRILTLNWSNYYFAAQVWTLLCVRIGSQCLCASAFMLESAIGCPLVGECGWKKIRASAAGKVRASTLDRADSSYHLSIPLSISPGCV